jgi:uncharacterized Zn finger protein
MERPNEVIEVKPWLFKVRSKNLRKYYEVTKRRDESFSCTCPSAKYNANDCKHILMVRAFDQEE